MSKVVDYVERISKKVENRNVLDIGCLATYEQNELKRYLKYKRYCKSILGIDIKEPSLTNWKKEVSNLEYCDITNSRQVNKLLEKYGQFDQLIATDIIEHIDNHRKFLNNCRKLLKSNGLIHITTPNMRSPVWLYKMDINRDHVCWFDIYTIKSLLGRFNFEMYNHFYSDDKKAKKICSNLKIKFDPICCKKLYVIGRKL